MDTNLNWKWDHWKPSIYRPRQPCQRQKIHEDKARREGPVDIAQLQSEFNQSCENVIDAPYDPFNWICRAYEEDNMGYPELAAFDAYKAILLFDLLIERDSDIAEIGWLQLGFAIWASERDYIDASAKWTPDPKLDQKSEDQVREQQGIDPNVAPVPKQQTEVEDLVRSIESKFTEAIQSKIREAVRSSLREIIADSLDRFRGDSYTLLLDVCINTQAYADAERVCNRALQNYEKNFQESLKFLGKLQQRDKEALRQSTDDKQKIYLNSVMGHIKSVRYPWIPPEFLYRSDKMIEAANTALRPCTDCLSIRRSGVEAQNKRIPLWETADCRGMFASRKIKAGEKMFQSKGPFNVSPLQQDGHCYNCTAQLSPSPQTFPCCPNMKFCTLSCRNIAEHYYHRVLCGKDFSDVYKYDNQDGLLIPDAPEYAPMIWLRALAICVQHGGHPLRHPIFSNLRLHYRGNQQHPWSLETHVIAPIKILQRLGIDVYTNSNYDGWVLQTLWFRMKMNAQCTRNPVATFSIDPMYCFFNHSCERPGMMMSISETTQSVVQEYFAARDIKEGEEVFTNYLDHDEARDNRNKLLRAAFGGSCACTRCIAPGDEFTSSI